MTRFVRHRTLPFAILTLALAASATAQDVRALQPEDYGRWERLVPQRDPLSPDGRWLVHGIARSSGERELRLVDTSSGETTTIAYGEGPAFSADARWLAYLIGVSEEEQAKLTREKKPLRKRLGLRDLATGTTTELEGIETFAFSPAGTYLALRRYPPELKDEPGQAPRVPEVDPAVPASAALVVRELATGRSFTFGQVSEWTWQDPGERLAFVTTVDGGVGNGVHVFDATSGVVRPLDSSTSIYSGLAWRKDATALAVLRASTDETREGATHVALVWPDLVRSPATMRLLDAAEAIGPELRVVRARAPRWSEDGARLYVGIAAWPETLDSEVSDTASGTTASPATTAPRRIAATSGSVDAVADVLVWHHRDTTVMAKQQIDARRDRQQSMLAAWWVDEGRLVRIATTLEQEARIVPRTPWALVVDTAAFAMDRSFGRVHALVWAVDVRSGERHEIGSRLLDRHVQTSPGGRYVLYLADDHFWTLELATGRRVNITEGVPASFVDLASDETVTQKPPFGVAGWAPDDARVLLYDELDVWEVAPDGRGAVRLTDGAADRVRHRVVRLDRDEEWLDRTRPLPVSLFGRESKRSGYGRILPARGSRPGAVERLVWLDKRVHGLARAKGADRYTYIVEGFDDSPDYLVGGPALGEARQVTATNPFMAEYAWGRAELVEYACTHGATLQGALYYPAGWEAGRRYPLVVYTYEKRSDSLHQFSTPSERDYYNPAAFTTRGYFYLQPDIVFRPREPGRSVVDCVVPAVETVVALGHVDPARVGVVGHSWGGFNSVYLATHTEVFAAAVAGAPITNLVSNYGNHHWVSGIAETDHIETGQQRMEVPLYDDLDAYVRNSGVFGVHRMKTPLLVAFGDDDGTVHWHQGVELYNVARRAGAPLVMLVYPGEAHGLRKTPNQIDYHHRIFEWFDHYLRGGPASSWITGGESFLDRERDVARRKRPAKETAKPEPTTSPSPPAR